MSDRGAEARTAAAAPKGGAWKKPLLTVLQVVFTLTVLYLVFRDPAKRAEMVQLLGRADRWWLVAGFTCYGLVEVIAGVRWLLLLRVQGIQLGSARLIALLLIGLFFNYFIPGGTGGDVVKIFYLLKETPGKRSVALLSVLIDRLIGVVALCAIAACFALTRWSWLMSSPATVGYVWTGLGILGSSLAGLHFTYIITRHNLIHRLPARLPGRDKFAELALAYNLYGKAWRASLAAFVLSILANLGYFGVFFCAAQSFRQPGRPSPSFADFCAILPIVNTITSMPISLGGVGVREGLFQVFLGQLCGVSEAVAVMISSVGYLLTLGWGLIGGLIYLFYRPSEHARLGEIKAEVRAFEHTVAEEEIALEASSDKEKP
ncbi:MAG: lysylphosphatidylglycerol synthase transmembrane domain-containing protein [Chthoniobacteraceae bacterium]